MSKKLSPNKCLKHVVKEFLLEKEKLSKSENAVLNKNFYRGGSFFLKNADVEAVSRRQKIIEDLVNKLIEAIFHKSADKKIRASVPVQERIKLIDTAIDGIDEAAIKEILILFSDEHVSPYLKSDARTPISKHSFNSKYFFTFLSKMIQEIKNTLGLKTSSEKILTQTMSLRNKL